jgi:cephalosporin-C deacetylase-like acetyl esterase
MSRSERVALWVVLSYGGGIALVVMEETHRGWVAVLCIVPYLAAMMYLLGRP